jgi:dTDP-glucose 4,6-dehydratase
MRKRISKILVTGGAGFIGSAFVRLVLKCPSVIARCETPKQSHNSLVVVDKLTYAGDLKRLQEVKGKFKFYKTDICNKKQIDLIFAKEKPEIVVHFAAESHVDRSIEDASVFIDTNIKGTQILLDASRKYGIGRFVHMSTDEVYGDIEKGQFFEHTPLNPSSPYSSSKAAGDLLVKSYIRTFGFPAVIVRPSNNYGPWQYPEKLIPVVIFKALNNQKVPVYAKGLNVREWLYVSDCADAIRLIMEEGKLGATYNLGSGNERRNIDIVKRILDILNKPHSLIQFVQDRPGHDIRYSLNFNKLKQELGWHSKVSFDSGMRRTVDWYVRNYAWTQKKVRFLEGYWSKVYYK